MAIRRLGFRAACWLGLSLAWLPVHAMAYCGSTSSEPTSVVDAQFAAYNAHDFASFAACYADDVSMIDITGKYPPIKGMAELKRAFAYLSEKPRGNGVEIIKRIVNGPVVIDQERPFGMKGKPDVIAVYEVRNGKIQNVWFPPSQ